MPWPGGRGTCVGPGGSAVTTPWQRDTPGTSQNDPLGQQPPGAALSGGDLCVLRHRKPALAEAGLRLCRAHLSGLQDTLRECSSLFADLDDLAVPGPSTEEHVRGKPVASKPPFRLDVMVVADTRLVEVVDDVVPVGVLFRWAVRLGEEPTMSGSVRRMNYNLFRVEDSI